MNGRMLCACAEAWSFMTSLSNLNVLLHAQSFLIMKRVAVLNVLRPPMSEKMNIIIQMLCHCFSFPNSDFLALTALNFSLTISK